MMMLMAQRFRQRSNTGRRQRDRLGRSPQAHPLRQLLRILAVDCHDKPSGPGGAGRRAVVDGVGVFWVPMPLEEDQRPRVRAADSGVAGPDVLCAGPGVGGDEPDHHVVAVELGARLQARPLESDVAQISQRMG